MMVSASIPRGVQLCVCGVVFSALVLPSLSGATTPAQSKSPVFIDDAAFIRLYAKPQSCAATTAKAPCIRADCAWCASDVVPSACYSAQDAQDLPSSTFACETQATSVKALERIAGYFVDDNQCHAQHSADQCKADNCAWCASAAVPSSCYTKEEAKQLPPAVFHCEMEDPSQAPSCHDQHSQQSCVSMHCSWCRSAAVPSACYTSDEAQGLPPGVFTCENKQFSEPACHSAHTSTECAMQHCVWCQAGAVPSACFTPDEAAQLPPAVFKCDKNLVKVEAMPDWELRTVSTTRDGMRTLFAKWSRFHGRQYGSALEKEMRLASFEKNALEIAAHNNDKTTSFVMALNQFADMSWEEFRKLYLSAPQNCSATHARTVPRPLYDSPPDAIDWRERGAVSRVKNQGACGSCWTFSSTGCLESHLHLKHGQMTLLSEQNLLDCAGDFDTHGCNGGLPSHAFEYVKYNGGIDTEDTYPYETKQGKCRFNTYHIGAQVDAVVNITARDESELHAAVGTVGPVSIAFQVAKDFRFYKSGIYDSKECKQGEQDVNHAVLAVGYGVLGPQKFWIVKNSWGEAWGLHGFFNIARDKNMCGLADCASYPILH